MTLDQIPVITVEALKNVFDSAGESESDSYMNDLAARIQSENPQINRFVDAICSADGNFSVYGDSGHARETAYAIYQLLETQIILDSGKTERMPRVSKKTFEDFVKTFLRIIESPSELEELFGRIAEEDPVITRCISEYAKDSLDDPKYVFLAGIGVYELIKSQIEADKVLLK